MQMDCLPTLKHTGSCSTTATLLDMLQGIVRAGSREVGQHTFYCPSCECKATQILVKVSWPVPRDFTAVSRDCTAVPTIFTAVLRDCTAVLKEYHDLALSCRKNT